MGFNFCTGADARIFLDNLVNTMSTDGLVMQWSGFLHRQAMNSDDIEYVLETVSCLPQGRVTITSASRW